MKKSVITLCILILFFLSVGVHSAETEEKENTVTKGEFIIELLDTMGVDVAPYEATEAVPFSDVSAEFSPYLDAAIRLGIIEDVTKPEFGENEEITREQAYTFLVRSLNLRDSYSKEPMNEFSDVKDISSWAREELAAAISLDLIEGIHKKKIRPKKLLTIHNMEGIFKRYKDNFDRLSIVVTNDVHGRVLPNNSQGEMGMAKIATIVNQLRKENKHTYLFDAGDAFHGTNYVNVNDGVAAVKLMNAIGYDAMVLGNHDFNYGKKKLAELILMAEFPILSGNVQYETSEQYLTKPYITFDFSGKKVALLSVTVNKTSVKTGASNVEGLQFEPEVEAVERLVEEVKEDVDHIFLLSHCGYNVDKKISEIDDIDLIMGGHTHTTLEYPQLYEGTYITQGWEHGKAVSVLHVLFHNEKFVGIQGHLVRDHSGLEENESVKSMLEAIKAEVGEVINEIVATIDVDLNGGRKNVRTKETNLGNLITDIMKNTTEADIAFMNGGGIRTGIPAGDVTVGNVYDVFPFGNRVVTMEVTGEDILRSLEFAVRKYPKESGDFLHVSGMSFTFDRKMPEGERVTDVFIGDEPLNLYMPYKLATDEFLASGGDGYSWLAEKNIESTSDKLLSELFIEYLKEDKPFPTVEGRIKVKQNQETDSQ
ncbi:5'-nucleotidase C-terminal domain-containing protein [Bacillus shivajii]|uniref:5'-nucleotidase C-terminal domain-containing protein n=1 Tax=Bacillus shivajii TaxID=1983719 RepID=UPI001CFC32B7|nr:5'-nucleotidase C-terminal domain-containing protein [Bacillus shivajii]UCZ53894.1 5'-nucleotidase C-terminal domain-containing protein [Bacillus shivajii]